jgi:cellulose synthase/poly-beta-1,6-N-acetylglucosamine synthase-like glycosyltransferase
MLTLISLILAGMAALLSVPIAVLFVEVIAALNTVVMKQFEESSEASNSRIAVIVPAHNESTGVVPTIEDIKPQLGIGDRLIVVADNCSDDTAAVARASQADVIERNDLTQIGKGYALGWAINHLEIDPPDFVVFIDADCRIEPDMIGRLKQVCSELQRPVQACFLMKTADDSPIDHSLAEFAWILKNWVRPLGLRYLNCPVQLMGTGMIFPWEVIRSAPLASGDLVEDLKLGLDLAAAGKAPYFFPFVIGSSLFPISEKGTDSQRKRWVQGHLHTIITTLPRLLFLSISRRNLDLLVMTLDLAVPPLSLLGLLIVAMFALSCVGWLVGLSSAVVVISAANLLFFALSILLAWSKFARHVLSAGALLSIGALVGTKVRLYVEVLLGRAATQWIRTDRGKPK